MNTESTEIAEVKKTDRLSVQDVVEQIELINQVMRQVMKEETHYGTIPGCKKKSLFKAGAEKLSTTFRLRPIIDNANDIKTQQLDNGHINVVVYCHIINYAGVELATGVGSCSTLEVKYRYRGGEKKSTGRLIPKEYWNFKKAGKTKEAQSLIGGDGYAPGKGGDGNWYICEYGAKQENPDIADCYNTVLKMACKRAYVAGVLSATGASDIFTQDMEDFTKEEAKPEKEIKEPQPKKEHELDPLQVETQPEAPLVDTTDIETAISEAQTPLELSAIMDSVAKKDKYAGEPYVRICNLIEARKKELKGKK